MFNSLIRTTNRFIIVLNLVRWIFQNRFNKLIDAWQNAYPFNQRRYLSNDDDMMKLPKLILVFEINKKKSS